MNGFVTSGRGRAVTVVVALLAGLTVVAPGMLGRDAAQAAVTYYLPYPAGQTYTMTQGPLACNPSHCAGTNSAYAYDFAMGRGKPIVASAPGCCIGAS